jgi:hypothetical protein
VAEHFPSTTTTAAAANRREPSGSSAERAWAKSSLGAEDEIVDVEAMHAKVCDVLLRGEVEAGHRAQFAILVVESLVAEVVDEKT